MTKNDEQKITRAEYRAQQDKKSFFSKIFKRKNKKSASGQTDDDFLVFNDENENYAKNDDNEEVLTEEQRISILKHKLNIGIIIVIVLLVVITFVLFKI